MRNIIRHLMRLTLLFILTILTNASYGQTFTYPSIKLNAQRISDFVPVGWTVLDSAIGDLNKDGFNDVAIILQYKDSISLVNGPGETVLTKARILLILFKNPDTNKFSLVEESNSFILNHDNSIMDDPYQGIAIDKGILKINFHLFYNMGSWYSTSSSYKFRYDGSEFILIGADLSIIHRTTLDYKEYSYNFLTKKRSYTKGNEQKGTRKTTIKNLNLPSFKTLKTLKRPYTFEIEKDVFL